MSTEDLNQSDEAFMRAALDCARAAERQGEVPVGAVVVVSGEIIGGGGNAPISRRDPTAHAEVLALQEAAAKLRSPILTGATLYCTIEPCVMCAGAVVAAKISRLVFGARDLRFGGVRTKFQIADSELLDHCVQITEGILAPECREMLQEFFKRRR